MSIEVESIPEADPFDPLERCCFCRTKTGFWTTLKDRKPGDQVACCEVCARRAKAEDVPSKRDWCRRERIASPSFV